MGCRFESDGGHFGGVCVPKMLVFQQFYENPEGNTAVFFETAYWRGFERKIN